MPTITLTIPEWSAVINAAWLRIVTSAKQGLNHATTYERSLLKRLEEEVTGAAGELAVGKWSGSFFVPSVNTYHRVPDCLEDVEVRSTRLAKGCLIVRDNDADDRRYVLAIVDGDTIRLAGWMHGRDAKCDEWFQNPHERRPAWFVPQEKLRPMEELQATAASR
jgi:hypothetical protein